MTKENIKRMLTEMIEREFDIEEIAHVFGDIESYLGEKRSAELEDLPDRQDYREMHLESAGRWRKWTEETLESLGLNYTIEEIEE